MYQVGYVHTAAVINGQLEADTREPAVDDTDVREAEAREAAEAEAQAIAALPITTHGERQIRAARELQLKGQSELRVVQDELAARAELEALKTRQGSVAHSAEAILGD